jgi:hypothetical protein
MRLPAAKDAIRSVISGLTDSAYEMLFAELTFARSKACVDCLAATDCIFRVSR